MQSFVGLFVSVVVAISSFRKDQSMSKTNQTLLAVASVVFMTAATTFAIISHNIEALKVLVPAWLAAVSLLSKAHK
jgi:hypothetical protein